MTLDKMQEVLESKEKWKLKEEWNPKEMWKSEDEWNNAVAEINDLANIYKNPSAKAAELGKSMDDIRKDTYRRISDFVFEQRSSNAFVHVNYRKSNDADDVVLGENVLDMYWDWDNRRKVCDVVHVYETLDKQLNAFITSNTQHSFWRFFTYALKGKPRPSPGKPPPTPPEEMGLSREDRGALSEIKDFCETYSVKATQLTLNNISEATGFTRKSKLVDLYKKYMWQNKSSLDDDLGDGNTLGGIFSDPDQESVPETIEALTKEYVRAKFKHEKCVQMMAKAVQHSESGYDDDKLRMIWTSIAVESLVGSKEFDLLKKTGSSDYYFVTNYENVRKVLRDYTKYKLDLDNIKQRIFSERESRYREHKVGIPQLYDWCEAKSLFVHPVGCELFAMGEIPSDKKYRKIGERYGVSGGGRAIRDVNAQNYVRTVFKSVIEWIEEEMR